MTAPQFVAIRFATVVPGTYRWLSGLSFKPGAGLKVAKMQSGMELAKAQRFSLSQAREIALQYYHLQAAICHPVTGAELLAETESLRAAVLAKREDHLKQEAIWREREAEIWAPIAKEIRAIIDSPTMRGLANIANRRVEDTD